MSQISSGGPLDAANLVASGFANGVNQGRAMVTAGQAVALSGVERRRLELRNKLLTQQLATMSATSGDVVAQSGLATQLAELNLDAERQRTPLELQLLEGRIRREEEVDRQAGVLFQRQEAGLEGLRNIARSLVTPDTPPERQAAIDQLDSQGLMAEIAALRVDRASDDIQTTGNAMLDRYVENGFLPEEVAEGFAPGLESADIGVRERTYEEIQETARVARRSALLSERRASVAEPLMAIAQAQGASPDQIAQIEFIMDAYQNSEDATDGAMWMSVGQILGLVPGAEPPSNRPSPNTVADNIGDIIQGGGGQPQIDLFRQAIGDAPQGTLARTTRAAVDQPAPSVSAAIESVRAQGEPGAVSLIASGPQGFSNPTKEFRDSLVRLESIPAGDQRDQELTAEAIRLVTGVRLTDAEASELLDSPELMGQVQLLFQLLDEYSGKGDVSEPTPEEPRQGPFSPVNAIGTLGVLSRTITGL